MSKITATNMSYRMNLRRTRAEAVASLIMREIQDMVPQALHRKLYGSVITLLTEAGIEVLTDHHREQIGLAPRDREGWTTEEIHLNEARYLQAMLQPVTTHVVTQVDTAEVERLRDALQRIPKELYDLVIRKNAEGKTAAAINIKNAADIAREIASSILGQEGKR